jgi:preprotein translocase subunit SecA
MERLGMEEDEPIEHSMISRAIENAQRKVEGHNFEIRKHLLEYDDVMNKQREIIYSQRRELLQRDNVKELILEMIPELVAPLADQIINDQIPPEDWDWAHLEERLLANFGFSHGVAAEDKAAMKPETLREHLLSRVLAEYEKREQELGEANLRHLERMILLQVVDSHWKEHLLNMDHLKEGIGLRGYGQKNPLNEYKKEGYEMFMELMENIKQQTISTLFMVRLVHEDDVEQLARKQREQRQRLEMNRSDEEAAKTPVTREGDKVGRNDLCPCGSGNKYKRCCGKAL